MKKNSGTKNGLIFFLLVVIAVLAFVVWKQKSTTKTPTSTTNTETKSNTDKSDYQPKPVSLIEKYSDLLPSIQTLLKSEISNQVGDVSPEKEVDITGDGRPELLLDLGYGGATSSTESIVKIDNNIPKVVKVKDSSGKIINFSALSGGGGAGRYGFGVDMIKSANSIKTTSYYVYGDSNDTCEANVYTWNSSSKIFEYNKTESIKATADQMKICLKIATQTGVKYKGK